MPATTIPRRMIAPLIATSVARLVPTAPGLVVSTKDRVGAASSPRDTRLPPLDLVVVRWRESPIRQSHSASGEIEREVVCEAAVHLWKVAREHLRLGEKSL